MSSMRFPLLALVALAAFLTVGAAPADAQQVHGFVEGLVGVRTAQGNGFDQGSYTAQESRLQLRIGDYGDDASYFARVDFLYDPQFRTEPQYSDAVGVEIREAHITYTGIGGMDFKLGRQPLTWGTGDLLFINDVFAKDWESFFIGRDAQYLKIPHNALRWGMYPSFVNVDLVLMPTFEASRLPSPPRLDTFYPFGNAQPTLEEPANTVDQGEIAARLSRYLGAWDVALYGHWGRLRQPLGAEDFVPDTSVTMFYPRFNTYGLSLRTPLLAGLVNLEGGYLDSRQDQQGDNPLVENSSMRGMFGYDRPLGGDFQLGIQGYYEWMLDYDRYQATLAPGQPERDELRQLYTLRLTRWFQYQTLQFSLFTYWSPTDKDYYLRFFIEKKLTDAMALALGTNVFGGEYDWTLFGSQEYNDNVYLRARYSF